MGAFWNTGAMALDGVEAVEAGRLEVIRFVVGALRAGSYAVVSEGRALVVDPGEGGARVAAALDVPVELVVATHGHADHVGGVLALVEATAKAQAEQHGFALPLSKFAACLTPDISGEDAAGIIGQVYAAEAEAREESKPAHVVKPAEPRPDSFIEREEGFPFAPPVNVACTLTLSVKYAPKYEDTVQEALAMLRTVGVVTVF